MRSPGVDYPQGGCPKPRLFGHPGKRKPPVRSHSDGRLARLCRDARSTFRSKFDLHERRQHERWFLSEPNADGAVKGIPATFALAFFAQLSFPILAIATDSTRVATVCLSGSFREYATRVLRFPECAPSAERTRLAMSHIAREIRERSPAMLVVEKSSGSSRSRAAQVLAKRIAREARTQGLRVHALSATDAVARIGRPENTVALRDTVAALLTRYRSLADRLAPGGVSRLRDSDCWRQHRSLAAAICLAHAAGLDALARAARVHSEPPRPPL